MPTSYAITILVDEVDVTQYADYHEIRLEDHIHDVSSFSFTLQNPSGVVPVKDMVVQVFANNLTDIPTIFYGYIVELQEKKRSNGITKEYEIEVADRKIRLQKSVTPAQELSGSDTDILSDLLSSTYPDLSGEFDFSTGATSINSAMNFQTNEGNLLDALNDLADKTGAKYSFKKPHQVHYRIGAEVSDNVDYDDPTMPLFFIPRWSQYCVINPPVTFQGISSGGNPNNCVKAYGTSITGPPGGRYLLVEVWFLTYPAIRTVNSLNFDVWFDLDIENCEVYLFYGASSTVKTIPAAQKQTWISIDWKIEESGFFPRDAASPLQIVMRPVNTIPSAAWEMRIDNIDLLISLTQGDRDELQWDTDAPLTDFNLNIQSGTEYGADYNLNLGSFDDYNSVIVVGGNEDIAITEAIPSDGTQFFFGLPMPIKNIAVDRNTGSDISPTWTTQTVGTYGIDTTSTKDVLYDPENHFLQFATAPANMVNSFRITGTRSQPIRVRVENVSSGGLVYATSINDDSITTSEEAAAVGLAELNRRNTLRQLSFVTYDPGLKPGQKINVTDSARGLNENIVIRKITTTWLGSSGHAKFEVECGEDEGASFEGIVANSDRRSRATAQGSSLATTQINLLTDDDGIIMTDDDGYQLYEIV